MFRSMAPLLGIVAVAGGLMLWSIARPSNGTTRVVVRHEAHDPVTTRLSDEGDPGENAYRRYCAGCHGVAGNGEGPAARFLFPKPRDFTKGLFKFTSRPSSLPTDDDLLRTITNGLQGTSMPGWRFLPLEQRHGIVRYLKTFLPYDDYYEAEGLALWEKRDQEAEAIIPFHQNPYRKDDLEAIASAIEKGRELYHGMLRCWSCHPSYLSAAELTKITGGTPREDLEHSVAKPDQWGQTILPPNFPTDRLKSVRDVRDLYRVILAGVGGTAMPSWASALDAEQSWAITLYIDSIRRDGELHRELAEKTRAPSEPGGQR